MRLREFTTLNTVYTPQYVFYRNKTAGSDACGSCKKKYTHVNAYGKMKTRIGNRQRAAGKGDLFKKLQLLLSTVVDLISLQSEIVETALRTSNADCAYLIFFYFNLSATPWGNCTSILCNAARFFFQVFDRMIAQSSYARLATREKPPLSVPQSISRLPGLRLSRPFVFVTDSQLFSLSKQDCINGTCFSLISPVVIKTKKNKNY